MANEAEFTSTLGENALLFRRLHGREELGRLPEYRLELLRPTKKDPITASQLLGTKAGVKLALFDGTFREINGIVTRFEKAGKVGRYDLYHIELAPWLWHLTLGADCRVFQDKTSVQIIETIFGEYSSSTSIEKKLTGSYGARPYVVQYRESDFTFVTRLMEEEGLYYYFKHARGQHTLVLCDGPTGHAAMPGGKLSYAVDKDDTVLSDDVILNWRRSHALQPLKFAQTDFAAEAPTTDLLASESRTDDYPAPNDLEVFNYPGGHDDSTMGTNTGTKVTEGKRTAKLRVNEWESKHIVAAALTEYRALAVGSTFSFTDHPDAGDYLVSSAIFDMEYSGYEANDDGVETEYSCRFDAVPKSVTFQPERRTATPVVTGPQTATVVGPSGDEIFTDQYGRVKVQFHWDRVGPKNETSSCWVRVSQPWASKGFGFVALPRIGDEVVVDFLEGNPDRPLITGRVYNADNMPPYTLPAQATVSGMKSQSSKGGSLSTFNELRLDDKKGSEYIWFQAEKNYHQMVKHDAFESIKNDLFKDITKNAKQKIGEHLELTVGKSIKLKAGEDTHVKLGADLNMEVTGAHSLKVADKIAIKGDAAVAITSGQGMDISVGQALNISSTSAMSLKGMGVVIDGGTELTIVAGGSFIKLDSTGVTIQGMLTKINSGGSPGNASTAAQASPTAPQEPGDLTENTDPLAS
jgi:type VI secretion system secreted protein VgrG